jgi:hypothetical protein
MSPEERNYWWELLYDRRMTQWRVPFCKYNGKVHVTLMAWDKGFYESSDAHVKPVNLSLAMSLRGGAAACYLSRHVNHQQRSPR